MFFGKNNVGKSNILRGLHLAFYCLKSDEIFLPDTMFYNRNIYKPIEITVDLILGEDFFDTEKVNNALTDGIEDIPSVITAEEEIFRDSQKKVEEFIKMSGLFKPLNKFRLKMDLNYNEETSDIRVSIEDLESNYLFDYGEYKILYEKLENLINEEITRIKKGIVKSLSDELSTLGIDVEMYAPPISHIGADEWVHIFIKRYLPRMINELKDPERKNEVLSLVRGIEERLHYQKVGRPLEPFSKTFNTIKEYFDKISDNFILIPNKEYCITNETTITFDAEDEGCKGGVGMDVLLYRIWNMTHGWTSWYEADGETMITIDEECTHYLEIKAMDLLGNMVIDNETFHVDLQPPSIIKTVNEPYCGPYWEGPDMIPSEYVEYKSPLFARLYHDRPASFFGGVSSCAERCL